MKSSHSVGSARAGQSLVHAVTACLAELPLAQREALVLMRYEGFSADSAARMVGVSASEVRQRAFAAYNALCRALADSPSITKPNP